MNACVLCPWGAVNSRPRATSLGALWDALSSVVLQVPSFPVLPVHGRWWVVSLARVGAAEPPGACRASCDEPFVRFLVMFI